MTYKKFPVYIPAGSDPSENDDPLLIRSNVQNKALIELNGKKIITYVLDALEGSKYVDQVFIVGLTQEELNYQGPLNIDYVPSVGSRMDTLMNFINYLEEVYDGSLPQQIMSFSADIPLITSEVIDRNLERLQDDFGDKFDDIELIYPMVPEDIVLDQYPMANKRFRKFKEGRFATGDFMVFSPGILKNPKTVEVTKKIMESRKTIVRLLLKFDILAPFKYIFGRLSVRESMLPFMREQFDVNVELNISTDPEICIDLDYPEDLEVMEDLLRKS